MTYDSQILTKMATFKKKENNENFLMKMIDSLYGIW
jgi:hypothetical protein